jgi:hypothetical protein
VTLTDLPTLVPLLHLNAELQAKEAEEAEAGRRGQRWGQLRVAALDWSQPAEAEEGLCPSSSSEPWDLVVGCDLLYASMQHNELLSVLLRHVRREEAQGGSSRGAGSSSSSSRGRGCQFLLAVNARDHLAGLRLFQQLLQPHFETETEEVDGCAMLTAWRR